MLGHEHPHTLHSMGNLSLIFSYLGRREDLEVIIVQVMETRNDLALTWKSQDRSANATRLMQRCYYPRQPKLGLDHTETKLSSEYLGRWRGQ